MPTTKKTAKKRVVRKKATVAKTNTTSNVTLTLKQALTIREFISKNGKTHAFLDKKLQNFI